METMRKPIRNRGRGAVLGLCLLLCPALACAHPHAWIDVRSTVVLSAEGLVSAIEQEWLFDELYSAAVLEEAKREDPGLRNVVGDFAARVIENLGPYGYFMRVTADGRPVSIAPVTQFKSEMKGKQLLLSFTAPLAEPVDPLRQAMQFAVYDPTYFIQMTHPPAEPPVVKAGAAHGCKALLKPANPSPKDVARALALDVNAAPQDDLGNLFAEKVLVQCK